MEVIRQTLKMLFLDRSWQEIVDSWSKHCGVWADVYFSKEWFEENYASYLKNYTLDQLACFYDSFQKHWMKNNGNVGSGCPTIFNAVLLFALKMLKQEKDGKLVCRFNSLLRWHDVASYLGEDLFTTAFLASKDLLINNERSCFLWENVIDTDKKRLRALLKKPLSDNHFHLYGSSMIFEINWIAIMNNLADSKNKLHYPLACLKHGLSVERLSGGLNMYSLLGKAAAIRVLLFLYITNDAKNTTVKNNVINICQCIDDNKLVDMLRGIDSMIEGLKAGHTVFDYAKRNPSAKIPKNHPCQMLSYFSGERAIMYSMYKRIFSNECDKDYSSLFYLYLVLKGQIRREFVHENSVLGLRNFQGYYRARREGYKKENLYAKLEVVSAVNSFLFRKNRSLEIRIAPPDDNDYSKSLNNFCRILKNSFKENSKCLASISPQIIVQLLKEKDNSKERQYRYKTLRESVKATILAMDNFKKNTSVVKDCLVGIDAAGAENMTRPEVFAQAFRYLKGRVPQMCFTYHVGEDFIDAVDGLRAIDELVKFCGWKENDRLGHALILGLNIEKYYEKRNGWQAMPLQILVDNIAWLGNKANEFGNVAIKREISKLYVEYFEELYNFKSDDYPLDIYYQSWLLRGDNPQCYLETYRNPRDFWSDYDKILDSDVINAARCCEKAKNLYKLYHFDTNIKSRGDVCIEIKISRSLIVFIDEVREKMLSEVEKKKFMIECNPSSNYKIGDIENYIEHPIFYFFTQPNLLEVKFPHNISVSINTDDKGIFNTSLEREYALLAAAYSKNHKGRKDQSNLYVWLDNVRKMGLEQRF